ncbi:MAG: glycosyltransferase family 2 protein [Duncaniella sp.]|nr:glycosyltransferase family 2 protein [Duncaniella sp.]
MENNVKPVAVIILNWNGEKFLRRFLPSVIAHTPADIADVIVADNGSTDGSVELLHKEFPTVKVLPFSENYGFADGYNRAIAATRYRYTVLLNSDVEVKSDWLTPLYKFMSSHPETGAVQPKILSLTSPDTFEYAGAAGGFIDRNGFPYCRGRIFSTLEKDSGQYDAPMQVFWATGACLMVESALYEKVGGLDSRFFAHMEEIDLCWRIHLAGREVWAVPEAKVYHLGGGSLPASDSRKTYLNFRNNLLMLYKNLPARDRKWCLIKRRLLDTVAWCKFIMTLDFKNASAILRAHRDYRRMISEYSATASPEVNLLKGRPNILTSYYLKGHKTFDRI